MRFISRSAFLALMAVCALSAVAVTSASATEVRPEFKPASGVKFPVAFSGSSGTVSFTEPATKASYGCTGSSVTGQIVGPQEVAKVVVKFSGCGPTYIICQKAWETKELTGRIAYINKASRQVGLLLQPATQLMAKCGGPLGEEILGSMLGSIGPVNFRQTGPFTLNYSEWTHFEGEEVIHHLQRAIEEGGKPRELSMSDGFTLTAGHAIEIAA